MRAFLKSLVGYAAIDTGWKLYFVGLFVIFVIAEIKIHADEPAPKQILVPFNEAEQKGMNDLQRDMNVLQLRVENFRLSKCLQESIPAAQCGQLAPTGVYRLVAPEKR